MFFLGFENQKFDFLEKLEIVNKHILSPIKIFYVHGIEKNLILIIHIYIRTYLFEKKCQFFKKGFKIETKNLNFFLKDRKNTIKTENRKLKVWILNNEIQTTGIKEFFHFTRYDSSAMFSFFPKKPIILFEKKKEKREKFSSLSKFFVFDKPVFWSSFGFKIITNSNVLKFHPGRIFKSKQFYRILQKIHKTMVIKKKSKKKKKNYFLIKNIFI